MTSTWKHTALTHSKTDSYIYFGNSQLLPVRWNFTRWGWWVSTRVGWERSAWTTLMCQINLINVIRGKLEMAMTSP